jgi:hypothetical protein
LILLEQTYDHFNTSGRYEKPTPYLSVART